MKILTTILFSLFITLSSSGFAYAATSEVTWTNYEKYRDIRPSNGSRKHFRESTFYNLEKHIAKLAEKLPEGQVLKIDVTDVDLAGDTMAGGIDQIRIVKDIYFPRINFSYQLVSTDGNVIESAEVILKDMSFLMGSRLRYRNESLGYEKNMLDEWFLETFDNHITKQVN
ncbi:DUF3016 domain-containing protein [Colwellia sp. 1_MG-2023]|uniref:DUF3016 domain-containing protein n=1 Tax=unclassified Colwellia TaxID=196834 RepID=UPI001C0A4A9E|nr:MULTISPECIES: DUF3016 domain-containing protein [unclassified Colwellia]MBU2925055.1 DUF3016 domain-containing protein [Colwellia sp. C2M11]MDO6651652.1 DUF3016 domain-containing protein [Colwellia sp. 3_MG-2023]MDO6664950.1 DUF3016 domain-containing protein [Colwellia sp. 2_MG-2023]MDO6689323.1 DUF3016 domain-containing protein [Colwellia sp. 1_MG-2023]